MGQDIFENEMKIVENIDYLRGIKGKDSTLIGLLSAFKGLAYRGTVNGNDEAAINAAIAPGIYSHGSGLYGTGNGWHGVLIVLGTTVGYTVQIDFPQHSEDHVIFWRIPGGRWEKITSVTV